MNDKPCPLGLLATNVRRANLRYDLYMAILREQLDREAHMAKRVSRSRAKKTNRQLTGNQE